MKECGFKIETQESRKYEYGPGKEFETRQDAFQFAKKTESVVKTQISLAGCWTLLESSQIVEEENKYFKIVIKLKTPIINF